MSGDVHFEDIPDIDEGELVHVTFVVIGSGSSRQKQITFNAAVEIMRAFRQYKLTKRGRNVGIVSKGEYIAFDLHQFCEIDVKVRNPRHFAKLVEANP